MINTDTKIKIRNSIIIGFITIIILLTQLLIWNYSKVNANGFDYMSNSSYNNTATIKTESEYYYNQIDNEFSYYQLNNNLLNEETLSLTRNMNYNQSFNKNGLSYVFTRAGTYSYANYTFLTNLQVNTTYTITFKMTTTNTSILNRFCLTNVSNSVDTCTYGNITQWNSPPQLTFTATQSTIYLIVYLDYANASSQVTTTMSEIMLVKGDQSSSYAKYTGLNNYYNVNFYGRLYDIEPNTQYTLFTGTSGNNSDSLANVYLSKNCSSANLNSCSFNTEINNIMYNSNNGSYTFTTPNYSDSKGVYYLVSDKANNGNFPTITGNMTLYKGNLTNSKSYYQQREKNYYIKTRIENIQKNTSNNYLFSGRSIYNTTTNVALIKFELTRYNMSGISTIYNYNLLSNESTTSSGYYTFNIPNLYDLNINEKGNISGSIPSIKFNNTEDYSNSVLQARKPMLYATWILNSQYLGNTIGLVGESLFKGFYNSYGMQGNLYNDDLILTSNFEFKNRYFNWNQFTNNMIVEGDNNNQFGFFVVSIGVRNTLTDNGQITPPNSNGFGNSNYEIYNTCEGNIFDDFGCYVSNAVTWTIFNIPIIGPIIGFITNLVTLMYNLVTALTWYQNLGILFGIFILIMFLKILSILWKGKDE